MSFTCSKSIVCNNYHWSEDWSNFL